MPMVEVGMMRMRMYQMRVLVAMGMRFSRRIVGRMPVLMMLVVVVEMFVFQRLMNMQVFVALSDV
jgi:hypothetical protein